MADGLIYDRDDVPAWMRIAGDAGWLRELIDILKRKDRNRGELVEHIINLERLVGDVDELADELFEITLQSMIDSGQIRRLPNGKLLPVEPEGSP